jgi:hypothetical protein
MATDFSFYGHLEKNHLENDEGIPIELPPGCRVMGEEEITLREGEELKWWAAEIRLAVEKQNPEYEKFLAQCRGDTRALRKALEQEVERRKLAIWITRGNQKGTQKGNLPRFNFFIAPPLLTNPYDETIDFKKTRHQWKQEIIEEFMLHFDRNHILHCARYANSEDDRKNILRDIMKREIEKLRSFLQANYGNWELIAEQLVNLMEKYIHTGKSIYGFWEWPH